jgi:hypothetical protein
MAIQYRALTRAAKLDAIESNAGSTCAFRIYAGSVPANCAAANSAGTMICDFNLPADWMDPASGGTKAKAGTWSGTATGGDVATHFRIYTNQTTKDGTTCFMQGTIGQGSGDLSLDNTTIANGQTVTINTFTINDNNP